MKLFIGNYIYRGRTFDLRWCAKTIKEAADRIGTNTYFIRTYCYHQETDKPFDKVLAIPYGHTAVMDIGHRNEMDYEDAKRIVDECCEKAMNEIRK